MGQPWKASLEKNALVANAKIFAVNPWLLQQEIAGGRKAGGGQTPHLLGTLFIGLVFSSIARTSKSAEYNLNSRSHLRIFCSNKRLLDVGNWNSEHLFPRDICCGRHGRLSYSVAIDKFWVALVATTASRHDDWPAFWGDPSSPRIAP